QARMMLVQVMQEEPRPPRKLNDRIPKDLETVCLKSMAKEPGRRYQTAGALAEDLRRFLNGEPILARPVGQLERLSRWGQRNPVVASWTAAVFVLLVIVAGVGSVHYVQMGLALDRESALRKEAERWRIAESGAKAKTQQEADRATNEADRSRRLRYASDMSLAYQAWEGGDTGRARDLLDRQRPENGQEDLRGFEWRYLWGLCRDSSRLTLRGHTSLGGIQGRLGGVALGDSIAFSPDGNTLVTCDPVANARIWDVASQHYVRIAGFLND